MHKVLRIAVIVALLAGGLLTASSAGAFTPRANCSPFKDPQHNQNGYYSNVLSSADGVKVDLSSPPPANQTWPNGFCGTDNTANNDTTSWAMLFFCPTAPCPSNTSFMQAGPIWDPTTGTTPDVFVEWYDAVHNILQRNVYPTVHPPTDGTSWHYEVSANPDGYLWAHIIAPNGGTLDVGSFVNVRNYSGPRATYEAETQYPETGYMGGHGGRPQAFNDPSYRVPAFGGVWTLAPGDMNATEWSTHPGHYRSLWQPSDPRCQLSCAFFTGEG